MIGDTNDNNRFFRSLVMGPPASAFLCRAMGDEAETVRHTIAAAISYGYTSRVIDLQNVPRIDELMQALTDNPDKSAVTHLIGGNEWLKRTVPRERRDGSFYDSPYVHHVNMARENIFDIGDKIIWWLDEEGITLMATEAPDYFSWRAGIYSIDPKENFGRIPQIQAAKLTS